METGKEFKKSEQNSISNFVPPLVKIPPAEEFLIFKKNIASLINLDLTNYKNNQMERRISSLMYKNGIDNLADYYLVLKKDSNKLEEFVNMLTINVSEFFRNPEKFMELEKIYLPELLSKHLRIKIWSAGCSIGAEIYSVAMMLDKLNALERCELIASDFDKKILDKAQSGIYNSAEIGTVQKGYENYFKPYDKDKGLYKIDQKLINKVKFEKRDLLNSKFDKNFDLILCRNVVIYFTDEAKDRLYKDFAESLRPGGILFIGSTERINNNIELGLNSRTMFYYQKV